MMVWTLLPTQHAESCYTVGGTVNITGAKLPQAGIVQQI